MFKRLRDQTLAVILSALIPVTSFAQTFRPNEEGSPSQIPQAEIGNTPIQINLETISPQSFPQLNSLEALPFIPKENEALRPKAPMPRRIINMMSAIGPKKMKIFQIMFFAVAHPESLGFCWDLIHCVSRFSTFASCLLISFNSRSLGDAGFLI